MLINPITNIYVILSGKLNAGMNDGAFEMEISLLKIQNTHVLNVFYYITSINVSQFQLAIKPPWKRYTIIVVLMNQVKFVEL